jgi:archaetidylinositol phosphate synthase
MVNHFFRNCKVLAEKSQALSGVLRLEGGEPFLYPARTNRKAQDTARMAVTRVNQSVLGALERPTLAWLAQHMSPGVKPDHLTLLGFSGALLTGTGFVLSCWSTRWLWLANFGLIANWLGDSVDGTLARYRQIERPRYGFFIDHTSDMFSQVVIFIAIGISPCAHFAVACLGLITFLMAFIYTMIGTHVRQRMRITYFGFGPTEIRALLFIGNLLVLAFGVLDVRSFVPYLSKFEWVSVHDIVISALAGIGVTLIAFLAVREMRALGAEDPPRGPGQLDRRL